MTFSNQKASLCVENDVILLERQGVTRVVTIMRTDVLRLLHEGHWGGTRTKQMARRYIWWPNVNRDVEIIAQNCLICRQSAKAPPNEFQPWPQPKKTLAKNPLRFRWTILWKNVVNLCGCFF